MTTPRATSTGSITAQATTLPTYTKAQVARHNTDADAWVTCGGYVHDITTFMNKHPGGASYLRPVLGKDVEEQMQQHNHSSYSYALLKTYVVGTIEGQALRQHHQPDPKEMRGYKPEELDGAVDFALPSLPQIHALGDKYWPWLLNRPVCRDNNLIIFPSSALEALSRYPWWYIWVLWTPVILFNFYLAFQFLNFSSWSSSSSSSTANKNSIFGNKVFDFGGLGGGKLHVAILMTILKSLFFNFLAGALTWSLIEYTLHRFVFHGEVHTPAGNVFHYFAHGIHHLIPTDSSRLTFPPTFGIVLGLLFFYGFKFSLQFLSQNISFLSSTNFFYTLQHNVFFSGFLFGYVMYDTMHYFFHHSTFRAEWFQKLKAAHMNHHYKNENSNFGVSSPLWDFVFGTWDAEAEGKMK